MILAFVRHGPAVPSGTAGIAETDRPLTSEGRKRTLRAFRGLRKLDLGLDAVHTSPLPRARETAEILSEVLDLPVPRPDDRLLPETPPLELLGMLRELGDDAPAFVGHEPALSRVISVLTSTPDMQAFRMKKAGVAVVRLRKLAPRPVGTLQMLLPPKALRAIGR